MKRFITFCASFLILCLLTLTVAGIWFTREIKKPGGFETDQEIIIQPGTSGRAIAEKFADSGMVAYPDLFYGVIRAKSVTVKAGEYAIPARSSINDILAILQDGKPIQRNFTLTEGQTVKQAMQALQENEFLTGDMPAELPPEGSLLPETYGFTRGDTREAIIKRMREAQSKMLTELWAARDKDLPIDDVQQAVTLASIVEKETGIASERAKIAGLFYNRLKIGMPLQSDPTVVYVITDHLGHMGGKPLLGSALQVDSPYNTYKVVGLPPGPIANPGKASLEAVLHPEHHGYLFFVADGTGGHAFSETLAAHNKNVMQWRKIKKKLK